MSKVLTTDDLLIRTRLRGMLPNKDVAFSDPNLINILNEEIDVFGVNQILKLNEGYLVYYEDQIIDSSKFDYVIPYRSIGNKLKEVEMIDTSGNIYECAQIEISQLPDYQAIFNMKRNNVFFAKNNYINFPNGFPISIGTLRMWFYLRPNKLVNNNKGAVISAINTSTGVLTLSNFPDAFSTATLMDFVAIRSPNKIYNYDIQLGVVDSTAKTIQFAVAKPVTSIDFTTGIFTLTSHGYYTGMRTLLSTTLTFPTGLSSGTVNGVSSGMLAGIVNGTTYYLIKIDANTFKLASSLTNAQAGTAVIFTDNGTGTLTTTPAITHLHSELSVGDYVNIAEESIVPNLPTELHPVLAQRAASLCVDSMEGTAEILHKRTKEMEVSTTNLIANRIEDAPKKITQRKGILRQNYFKTTYRP